MTDDQAMTLRMLISTRSSRTSDKQESEATVWTIPHKVVVVAGGRRGVGASTLAANLVAAAGHRGIRSVLINPEITSTTPRSEKPDFYLLDAGSSTDFEGIADFLVLVTSPDRESVTSAYSALKGFRRSDPELPAGIVVNKARSPEHGAALAERIASAATAFLRGPRVEVLGWILEDPTVARARTDLGPVIVSSPRSPAASGIRLCARRLWVRWRPRWTTAAAA